MKRRREKKNLTLFPELEGFHQVEGHEVLEVHETLALELTSLGVGGERLNLVQNVTEITVEGRGEE